MINFHVPTRALITGSEGQLAKEFIRVLQLSCKLICLNKTTLDITEREKVFEAVAAYRPEVIFNCAAYNYVDKAEEDFETAVKVNAEGVKNLAQACKRHGVLLVHYSTDGVFNGRKEDFYSEEDETDPISNYGKSKLLGEEFLREETDEYLLLRTSWVFGEGTQNFRFKLRKWSQNKRVLKVVCDQISVPTYTEDIVKYTLLALKKKLRGLYNLTNSGYASRYEFARYFFRKMDINTLILPATEKDFPCLAKRPFFSAMSNAKISKALKTDIPDWQDAVDRFVKRFGKIWKK